MNRIEFSVRIAARPWPGTRLYRVACPHGVSSAAVVPGANPIADSLVVDLILPGHQLRHGCSCELAGRPAALVAVPV